MAAGLNILGSGLLAAIGIGVLLAKPRRGGGRLLALAILLWSIQSIGFNARSITSDVWVRNTFLILATFLTVFLIALLPRASLSFIRARSPGSMVIFWSFAVLALVATGILLTDFRSILPLGSPPISVLWDIFVYMPFLVSFFATFVIIAGHTRIADGPERVEVLIASSALGLYLAYTASYFLVLYAGGVSGGPSRSYYTLLFAVGLVLMLGGALWLWVRAPRPRSGLDKLVVLCIVGACALGLITAAPALFRGAPIGISGLLRVVAAALLAYGILKHQIFGIDLKLKWTLDRGSLLAVFGGVFFLVEQAVEFFASAALGTLAGIAAALLCLIAFKPLRRWTHRFADRVFPHVHPTPEYFEARKLVVYRAAAQTAVKDGVITQKERAMLDALVRELGIPDADVRAVERDVLSVASAG